MTDPFSITRRAAALGIAGASLSACAREGAIAFPAPVSRQFPDDFIWGAATSAFQIEGALDADGRGRSIWDVFPRDGIADRSDAAVANDSYHRSAEDVDLLAGAGMNAYRFSISWPRVAPDGIVERLYPAGWSGTNQKGLDYYSRLVDGLLARGITPYATLFHWDLPLALQERGGWAARDTAQRFADYAEAVSSALGDRLKHIVILNEPSVHVFAGHVLGIHAPGLRDASLIGAVTHHQNLAQGLAIQALRAGRGDLTIGTTLAVTPSRAAPGGLGLNGMAADGFDAVWNRAYLDPLFKGEYPKVAQGFVAPSVQAGDMEIIRQPLDFLGVNFYSPAYLRFDLMSEAHIAPGAPPTGVELDAFGRHVDPSGLWQLLARVRDEYGNPRVLITENGCSDPFSTGPALLDDQFRITYLRRHFEAVKSAMEAGSDIGGYFHWTLVDNWEWAEGYRSKFGLVAQDRSTGARAPKASYAWFKALAESGVLNSPGS
ncbi:MAG: family 1 glycosylhydrolase [Terricaulis sp.]